MSLARQTSYNVAGSLLPMAVSLVTVPIYLKVIGIERYGVLALCWTILNFVSFVGLGVGPSVMRQLAMAANSSDQERARIFWTGASLSSGLAILSFPVLLILSRFYASSLELQAGHLNNELKDAIPWIAAIFSVSLAGGICSGTLQGRHWFGVLNIISISNSVVTAILPLAAAILLGPSLRTLLVATFIANFLSVFVQFLACWKAVPLGRPLKPERRLYRSLLSYGWWMTAITALAPIVMLIDRFVVGKLVGIAAVSAYVIGYNLVSRLTLVPAALHSAILPRFAVADATGEADLTALSVRWLLAVLTPAAVTALIFAQPFFVLYLGSRLGGQVGQLACILLIGFFAHGIGHVPSTVVMGRGRPDIVAKVLAAYVVPYVAALWIATEHFGVPGAAAVWSIRALCDYFLFLFCATSTRTYAQVGAATLAVTAAAIFCLSLSWHDARYWLVETVFLAGSLTFSWRLIGSEIRAKIGSGRNPVLDQAAPSDMFDV